MIEFKQVILPGEHGRDVRAVKRTMKLHMRVEGSGKMGESDVAGHAFVQCINHILKNHGYKQDGKYGKLAHGIVAPHMDAFSRLLYKRAKLRQHDNFPPITEMGAQAAAKALLDEHTRGHYHADNPGDLYDIQRTAKGLPVWSPLGYWVHLDKRPLEIILWLIRKHDFKIGTYAICSDHHTIDGRHGHNGGHAIDIHSINGVQIGAYSTAARELTTKVARLIRHDAPAGLHPWQQICNGYGGVYNSEIAACTIGSYNYPTLVAHRNHIHVGYYGS